MMLYHFPPSVIEDAASLLEACRAGRLTLASAESCTGGLIAAVLTDIAGASDVFDRGFVTYSNDAKMDLLGVPKSLLERHGAVSAEVACAMADGVLSRSLADLAVSVTGIAGPGGATETKPVGLVFVGSARRGHPATAVRHVFDGDRATVRLESVRSALARAQALIDSNDAV